MPLLRWIPRMMLALGLLATRGSTQTIDTDGPIASAWERPMVLGAHRGGKDEWPENTVVAFREAAAAYPDILLEGDLQLSRDGAVVVIHDKTVDRTTEGTGAVKDLSLTELKALDAGYRFTPDGGQTFPWRGKGVTIPTLEEVLSAAPRHRFLLELKDGDGLTEKAIPILRAHGGEERIIIASFQPELMAALRAQWPGVATCYDQPRAFALLTALRQGDWAGYTPTDRMLSLPKRYVKQLSITKAEIAKIQQKGILVQVHTLNAAGEITQYRALGVDSILTDRPALLATLLHND